MKEFASWDFVTSNDDKVFLDWTRNFELWKNILIKIY